MIALDVEAKRRMERKKDIDLSNTGSDLVKQRKIHREGSSEHIAMLRTLFQSAHSRDQSALPILKFYCYSHIIHQTMTVNQSSP